MVLSSVTCIIGPLNHSEVTNGAIFYFVMIEKSSWKGSLGGES